MKAGSLPDLQESLSEKEVFLIPYSTSHIGDILSSYNENDHAQKKRIEKDLDFITSITDNYCLSNNGKQIVLDTTDPHLLFQQRIDDSDLLDDFGLGKIEELFNVEGMPKGLGDMYISALKSIPIDESFKAALQNPESKETLQKIFPDLGENPTMEDFFRSFGRMFKSLNEEEGYKGLREITQIGLGINRDKIFNDNAPYDIIDNAHSRVGFKFDDYVDHSKYAPEWYNRITNEYLKLDMHGYQEDKVKVKPNKRKQTFANTTEDGSHAAFASTCNFYITNDKKSIKKTKQIYEKLSINTKVLTTQEFMNYHSQFLEDENSTIVENLQTVVDIFTGTEFEETEIEEGIRRIYQTPKFIFGYFNGVTRQWDKSTGELITMLFRNMPTNLPTTYVFEIRNLVLRIDPEFLSDEHASHALNDEAFTEENWTGIRWQFGGTELKLMRYQGHIQMYLVFPETHSTYEAI